MATKKKTDDKTPAPEKAAMSVPGKDPMHGRPDEKTVDAGLKEAGMEGWAKGRTYGQKLAVHAALPKQTAPEDAE